MIDAHDIDRIRTSFDRCIPLADAAAACFYAELFRRAPATRGLFTHDLRSQGRKLILTLAAVVDALDRLETILPTVRELAVRHVGYGVTDAHYGVAGEALIAMLRVQLGRALDDPTERAWRAAYGLIAETMIAAAKAR